VTWFIAVVGSRTYRGHVIGIGVKSVACRHFVADNQLNFDGLEMGADGAARPITIAQGGRGDFSA
jgi:hypothetical protein